jgi:dephospho-CoA kinase/inosine/xanthosine triphosphate pyrophosphatase family protein
MKSIVFITSNRTKLMHARHLAEPYDIEVLGKKYYGVAYREPRSLNRTELLQKSYQDALARWRKTSGCSDGFFFIEDTSVIIDALSRKREFPGVDVKYWMMDTTFAQLDSDLRQHRNNRRVTVRSDVLLHLPDWFQEQHRFDTTVLQFIGKESGTIIAEEAEIDTNLLYPWLDNRSFNRWFVPAGCDVSLSALPIEIADIYDFRRESIGAMFQFLEDKLALGERRAPRALSGTRFLPHLFPPLVIVTGLPCAGKTTLGTYLSEECGYYHIEASDFMKRAFYERHGVTSDLSIEKFAETVLKKEPDIVVGPVLREIEGSRAELVVVTGFRSPREIELFKRDYRGPSQIVCWFVDASQDVRFGRSCARGRHDAPPTLASFKKRDAVQLQMGLRDIRRRLREGIVTNEGTIQHYVTSCVQKLNAPTCKVSLSKVTDLHERPNSLEETILVGLAVLERRGTKVLSTTEIARQLNRLFGDSEFETNKNNVSRYFNFKASAFYRPEIFNGVVKYSLSATGQSRAIRLAAMHHANP